MKRISRQTRRRLRHGLIGFACLTALAGAWPSLAWLEGFEQLTLDLRYARFNRETRASERVVILDIDEPSLKLLAPSYGRWPWPRRAYKDLIEFLSSGEPAGIYFDIKFTEPTLGGEDDKVLAEASTASGRVSHAMDFLPEPAEEGTTPTLPSDFAKRFALPWKKDEPSFRPRAYRDFQLPAPELLATIPRIHVVSFDADRDGLFRRTPIALTFGDQWFPSLSLAAVLAALPGSRIDPSLPSPTLIERDGKTTSLPIDSAGRLAIHFYREDRAPTMIPISAAIDSAIKVQKGEVADPAALKVNPFDLKDKVILIGASAAGLEDLKATPVEAAFPGVKLHATTISNILGGDLPRGASRPFNLLITLILLIGAYACVLFTDRVLVKVLLPVGLVAAYTAVALLLFKSSGYQLALAMPLTVCALAIFDGLAFASFVENAERKRMQSTLSKYLPPAVTEQLIATGANPQAEVGRYEELSVLFSDIRGFTTLSERLQPQELVARLNDYLGEMTDEVFAKQGTLDKFIGDAVMAFWGAPIKDEQHALHAVSCAIEMQRRLEKLKAHWKSTVGELDLQIGVGINSGRVIVGNIGGEKRLDYTVIGDNVNLASRIEGLTKQYGVGLLVSERTRELIGDSMICRRIDQVRVKGKANHVTIYEPLSLAGAGTATEAKRLAERFEEGFESYLRGDFRKAQELFEALDRDTPEGDAPSQVYIERCKDLLEAPPTEWDGIYVAKNK